MHSSHTAPEATSYDAEKGPITEKVIEPTISKETVETGENNQLVKSLRSRHMQMIAIGECCSF